MTCTRQGSTRRFCERVGSDSRNRIVTTVTQTLSQALTLASISPGLYLSTVIATMLYVEETANAQKKNRDCQSMHSKYPRNPLLLMTLSSLLNKAAKSDTTDTTKSKILCKNYQNLNLYVKGQQRNEGWKWGWVIHKVIKLSFPFRNVFTEFSEFNDNNDAFQSLAQEDGLHKIGRT